MADPKDNFMKKNFLDKTISYFSPKRGLQRAQHRAAFDAIPSVKTTAGSNKGSMGNWIVDRLNRWNEGQHREKTVERAQDLKKNDSHAASIIGSMAMNIVGSGLMPQAQPNAKQLGWTEGQTKEFQQQAEWAFKVWSKEADARGKLTFAEMQYQTINSLLTNGEYFRIPLMLNRKGRRFGLALQSLSPLRVSTPSDLDLMNNLRDGIKFDEVGRPLRYYVSDPPMELQMPGIYGQAGTFPSEYYKNFPAYVSPKRPGMLHGFIQDEEEQFRGTSILVPAMKMFKDLSDYFDFELIGAIVASSFPVFIETPNSDLAPGQQGEWDEEEKTYQQEVQPGQIMYGNQGERPHTLSPERPSNSFAEFVEKVQRSAGASAGMPYEIATKDFSKTNYSSARAALMEADRVFRTYRAFFTAMFLQPVWNMVIEEAWLKGMVELPKGSPDFYEAYEEITQARWIPPKKGYVDPVKETQSDVKSMQNGIKTLSEVITEQGGDWESHLEQIKKEEDKVNSLGIQLSQKKE